MTEPTDNVSRLARIAKTMEAGHWHSSAKVVREAADEIERLRAGGCARDQRTTQFCAESVELEKQVSLLEQTVSKIEAELKIARDAHADWRMEATRCRKERDDAKARNVLLLSKLQEYEAREQ